MPDLAAAWAMDYKEFQCGGEWLDICRSKVAWTMERADELFGRLVRLCPPGFRTIESAPERALCWLVLCLLYSEWLSDMSTA